MRRAQASLGGGLPPLSVRISDACRMTGIGRSKLYELIKDGAVEVIKVGAITLVPVSSIQALLDSGHKGHAQIWKRGLAEVMHPLATAILRATMAGIPDAERRNLCSKDEAIRTIAEDAIVERLRAAFYEPVSESR